MSEFCWGGVADILEAMYMEDLEISIENPIFLERRNRL